MTKTGEYLAQPYSLANASPLLAFLIFTFFIGTGFGVGSKVRDILATNDYEVNRKIHFHDNESSSIKLIGQNSQYIFYVLKDDPTIHIAPIQGNIKQIVLIK